MSDVDKQFRYIESSVNKFQQHNEGIAIQQTGKIHSLE